TVANQQSLCDVVSHAVETDVDLREKIDLPTLQALFDPVAASACASTLASGQLAALRSTLTAPLL
ncbi:MAG TPA: 3-carboxy-cis,cis-muconate cycloisomerase, partial [Eoetvoesiella sp.]